LFALKAFQHEEWPAKKDTKTPLSNDQQTSAFRAAEQAALRHSFHNEKKAALEITDNDDQVTVESQETEETGTVVSEDSIGMQHQANDDDVSKQRAETRQSEQEKDSKEEASKPEAEKPLTIKTLPDASFHNTSNIPSEDDPQTHEPVHPAIVQLLEAFMMIIQDPAKQSRPIELVLEGVSMIVANCYLSGRAGGEGSHASLLHRLLECVAKSSESNNEAVQNALVSTLTTIMTCPKCSVHGNAMLTALRSTFHVYLVTKAEACKASAKRALLNMLKAVFFRMEAHEAVSHNDNDHPNNSPSDALSIASTHSVASEDSDTPSSSTTKPVSAAAHSFASQYHADAYYVLRSLCKLSSKELPADTTDEAAAKSKQSRLLFNTLIPTDPTELNSKILSLELILAAMEYCGEAFTSRKFLYLV
jgi:hypothetical protein